MIPQPDQLFRIRDELMDTPVFPLRCVRVAELTEADGWDLSDGPLLHITARLTEPGYTGAAHESYHVVSPDGTFTAWDQRLELVAALDRPGQLTLVDLLAMPANRRLATRGKAGVA